MIYQKGVRRRCGGLLVLSAPGTPGPPQVGFVAGKALGNAVRRNRAKRRLRAALEQVAVAPGTAHVVIAGAGVLSAEFDRLVEWLEMTMTGSEPRSVEVET